MRFLKMRFLKNTARRALSILLMLALVIGLMPGLTPTAKAISIVNAGELFVAGIDMYDHTSVDPSTATNININGTASLSDGESGLVLTLDGFQYTGPGHDNACIYYNGTKPLTIKLVGTSSLTSQPTDSEITKSYGIYSNQNNVALIFTGDGELTATGSNVTDSSYGIRGFGPVTISSGTITATGGSANGTNGGSYGISARNGITMTSGTLTAKSNAATYISCGVSLSSSTLTMTGGTLTAIGDISTVIDGTNEQSYGIHSTSHYNSIGSNVTNFTAIGQTAAMPLQASVKNAIPGLGWDNANGEGEATTLAISDTAIQLDTYKKVVFTPGPAAQIVGKNGTPPPTTDFATLDDAVTAFDVETGEKILLLTDATSAGFTITKGTKESPVVLDLNGKVLTLNGTINVGNEESYDGGFLTLIDTSETHTGRIVKGEKFSGNSVIGVNVETYDSRFIMNGGTIGGFSTAGVYVNDGAFTMTDGKIEACNHGVRVYRTFTMTGGTITNCANTGVWISNTQANFQVSGNPRIIDNAIDVCLDYNSNGKINVVDALDSTASIGVTKYGVDEETNNKIPIAGTFTNDDLTNKLPSGKTVSDIFFSNIATYDVRLNNDNAAELYVPVVATVTVGNADPVEYAVFNDTDDNDANDAVHAWLAAGGGATLTLFRDVKTSASIQVSTDDSRILNLAGHGITLTGDESVIRIESGAELLLEDSGADAETTHYYTIDSATGLATVDDANTTDALSFTGGYITGGKAGGVSVLGAFSMGGGTILGNSSTERGGGVFVSSKASFVMYSGSILGNKASISGGGVYVSGGYLDYTSASNIIDAGTFRVSDQVKITSNVVQAYDNAPTAVSNVHLGEPDGTGASRAVISLGELKTGARLGISLTSKYDGVFTEGWTPHMSSETPTDYFFSDDPAYVLSVKDGELRLSLPEIAYIDHNVDTGAAENKSTEKYFVLSTDESDATIRYTNTTFIVKGTTTRNGPISIGGTVNLILCDEATLNANAGIIAIQGATLNIFAQSTSEKMGVLNATAPNGNAAAIGGITGGQRIENDCGTINIHGGVITATAVASGSGAGIGGSNGGSGGNVTVYDGVVTATSGSAESATVPSAGIGSGKDNYGQGSLVIKNDKLAVYGSNTSLDAAEAYTDYATTRYRYMKIAKKPLIAITPTVSLAGWTYGQTAQTPVVTGNTGSGTITYAYKSKNASDDAYASTVPTHAGSYTVKATIAATDTYASGEATNDFTIAQATVTIRARNQSIYVGDAIPALGANDYTVSGLVNGDSLLHAPTLSYATTPDNTQAGSYAIVASNASAGNNYTINYQNGTLTISIAPHVHTLEHHAAVAATCDTAGSGEYWVCSGCGEVFSDAAGTVSTTIEAQVLPALGHAWGDWSVTKSPTRTEPGEETRVCQHDPSHVETREIPAVGPAVEAEVDTDVTGITVSNLEEIVEAEAGEVADNTFVKTEMTVTAVESSDPVAVSTELAATVDAAIAGAESSTVETKYLTIDVEKYVTTVTDNGSGGTTQQTTSSPVTDLGQVVEIGAPLAGLGIAGPPPRTALIVRQHGHDALVFHALDAKPAKDFRDGTSYYDRSHGTVYIYSRYFSTFAVLTSTAETFTVTLNPTGGSVNPSSLYATKGSAVTLPMPTHDGTYTFGGWYTAETGGTRVANPYPVLTDQTLYARWTYLDDDDNSDDTDDDDDNGNGDNVDDVDNPNDNVDDNPSDDDNPGDIDNPDDPDDDNGNDPDDIDPNPTDPTNDDPVDPEPNPEPVDPVDPVDPEPEPEPVDPVDPEPSPIDPDPVDDPTDDITDPIDDPVDPVDDNPGVNDDPTPVDPVSPDVPDNTPVDPGRNTGGGSSRRSATAYAITIAHTSHGQVTASPASATSGARVAVTAVPDSGYLVDVVAVTDNTGKSVTFTQKDAVYSFTQPASTVTVTVTFKPAETAPAQPDATSQPGAQPNQTGSDQPNHPGSDQSNQSSPVDPLQAFSDLNPAAWYADGIRWALNRGVMSGYGDSLFRPDAPTSRAMLTQILYNLENRPASLLVLGYSDVAPQAWYTAAVHWASANGIALGYDANLFAPHDSLTREQLVTILYRYALFLGIDVSPSAASIEVGSSEARNIDVSPSAASIEVGSNASATATSDENAAVPVSAGSNLLRYADASDVSAWATPAMQWAVTNGLLIGTTTATPENSTDATTDATGATTENAPGATANVTAPSATPTDAPATLNPKSATTRAEIATLIMRFTEKFA